MTIREISKSFLKLVGLDSKAARQLKSGYRNTEGERTQVGIHMFLNFLETTDLGNGFDDYLKAEVAAAEEEASKKNK